jgi:class 3 adenylate cyclase
VCSLQSEKQEQAANLLSMVVPDHVTKELVSHVHLRDDGKFALDEDTLIARAHQRVALCFIDICDFTAIASVMTPNR